MALPHSRTQVIRQRKQKNRGRKRKAANRNHGTTKTPKELFQD